MRCNLSTVAASYIARMAAGGSACHSDHARGMAFTLLAVANGEAKDFKIKDVRKLYRVAGILNIEFEGRPVLDVAKDVATRLMEDFGRQKGEVTYVMRAPNKTQERWRKYGVTPRGCDREIARPCTGPISELTHDPDSTLDPRTAGASLADGWAGSMISTDITDILFGTPMPVKAEASFGIFKEDEVNIVIHGHEPSLAEMIIDVVGEPDMIAYAKAKGRQRDQCRRHVLYGQ